MPNTTVELTIREARSLMRPQLNKGVRCLCCDQLVKLYTRSLSSSMIKGLILIYMESKDRLHFPYSDIHLEDFFKSKSIPSSVRGDIPKLRFWGFIEPVNYPEKEDGNPQNGVYRITMKGVSFVTGKSLVQKSVKIYNNTFRGFTGPEIDVYVAIKNKFSYNELMGGK